MWSPIASFPAIPFRRLSLCTIRVSDPPYISEFTLQSRARPRSHGRGVTAAVSRQRPRFLFYLDRPLEYYRFSWLWISRIDIMTYLLLLLYLLSFSFLIFFFFFFHFFSLSSIPLFAAPPHLSFWVQVQYQRLRAPSSTINPSVLTARLLRPVGSCLPSLLPPSLPPSFLTCFPWLRRLFLTPTNDPDSRCVRPGFCSISAWS